MAYREPEFMPWDGRRVPLTFVAGYLGAGKTTLINSLLRTADRPIAVIVNDVGQINVDAQLIRKHSGDTIELTDGCVCCSAIDGFGAAFDQLRARPTPPEHIVVELSGVAEPRRMLPWGRSAGLRLDGVMTLVAVDQFDELRDRFDLAAAIDDQIRTGDIVCLTKTDLVDAQTTDAVRQRIRAISPDAPVISADDPTLPTMLLHIGGRRPSAAMPLPAPSLFDRHEVAAIPLPQGADVEELQRLIDDLPPSVVRAKGIAAGPGGRRFALHVVGRRRLVTELADVESEQPTDLVTISLPMGTPHNS